jgi:exodeoxyribonuclease VII large subunit
VEDIRAQLKETEEDVELDIRRVSLSRPDEIVRELHQSCDAQLLVLTRGGGDDVLDLDTEEVIEVVASSPSPVVVAIGHAADQKRLVVGRVADASFPTPTALGAWLFETLKQKRLHAQQMAAAMKLEEMNQLRHQVRLLQNQRQADEQEIMRSRRAASEMQALAKHYRTLAWTMGALILVLAGLGVGLARNLWLWR